MFLKRSAAARRCASAAVSSGSTATGAVWGWREWNVKVRSSTMTTRITTTTSRAPRLFFIVRESAATALGRQGARGDDPSITLRCMISRFDYGDVRYFRMARTVLGRARSEEHTSELQSRLHLVCRLLLEKKKKPQRDKNTPHGRR